MDDEAMTTNNTDGAALLPVTREALIDEIISMYHTTRLSCTPAATHILSKGSVQDAFARFERGILARAPLPATQEDAERSGAGRKLGEWAAKNLRPDNATPQPQEYDGEAVDRLLAAANRVLAAMDEYNEKHGTHIGGAPFFELGRSIAALAHPAQATITPSALSGDAELERDLKLARLGDYPGAAGVKRMAAHIDALSGDAGEEQ